MRNRNATAYRFLAPYLLIFAVFWVWPIISSFMISFQATRTVPWRFAPGFNWGRLIGDPAFFNALKNTLLILVIQVPVMIALAMVMAVLLNSPLLKARGLYRFAFFAPVVVGEVAYSAVFRLMFSLDFGIVNKLLEQHRPAQDRLVLQCHAGHGADHDRGDLALGRLQRHHPARRPAIHPRGRL